MNQPRHPPPCVQPSSCTPNRCHPPLPPCSNPEKCLRKSKRKKQKCESAVSIMSARGSTACTCAPKSKCCCANSAGGSSRAKGPPKTIKEFNRERKKTEKIRQKGTMPNAVGSQCCLGRGHRGRIKLRRKPCCARCAQCCFDSCQNCCRCGCCVIL